MAMDVNSPPETSVQAAPSRPARAALFFVLAFLLAATSAFAGPALLETGEVDPPAQIDGAVPDQYAANSQSGRELSETLNPTSPRSTGRSSSHRSLLLEADALHVRPLAPAPLAPVSADPGADVIPLPASFVGGAAVLAMLVVVRYWRR